MKRRGFLRVLGAASAGAVVGGASIGLQERTQLGTTRTTVSVNGLPAAFRGFRIALLTDLHRSEMVSAAHIEHAVAMTMAERPDVIVLGGDFITLFDARFAGPVAEALSVLKAPAGVVAVLGNHDDDHSVPSALTHNGIRVLREDRMRLTMGGSSVDLIGIGFWTRGSARIRPLIDPVALPILIAHDPRRLSDAVNLDIPLVLSGHTHGGQIAIPGLMSARVLGFPILSGVLQREKTTLFVSRGIGTVYVPLRINCPPEVAILTLD